MSIKVASPSSMVAIIPLNPCSRMEIPIAFANLTINIVNTNVVQALADKYPSTIIK